VAGKPIFVEILPACDGDSSQPSSDPRRQPLAYGAEMLIASSDQDRAGDDGGPGLRSGRRGLVDAVALDRQPGEVRVARDAAREGRAEEGVAGRRVVEQVDPAVAAVLGVGEPDLGQQSGTAANAGASSAQISV
jgi:hypothetical protein